MILVLVAISSVSLRSKIDRKRAELEGLELLLEAEEKRKQEIEDFGKEVQTKGYIENVAREKLGLVYEDEILFKGEN